MLPDLSLVVALLFGLFALEESPFTAWRVLTGTAASVAVALALIRMAVERAARALEEEDLETVAISARWAATWPLLGWLVALQAFDWGSLVATWVPRTWWVGRLAILFLPAAVLFAASWAARARIEGAVARRRGTPAPPTRAKDAILQHLRRNALALLPFLAITAFLEGIWVVGELGVPGMRTASRWIEAMPLLALAVTLAVVLVLSVWLPVLFRRLLPSEPLPPGRTRTLIENTAKAIGLRYRHLLVWNTGGRVLNAMVVGLTRRTRAIFLTDGLLRALPDDEVLAVFAHEAGHAKRHHLPLFLVCFACLALMLQVATTRLEGFGFSPVLLSFLTLGVFWFLLLGWVSRRFERDADVYGAEHATAGTDDPGPTTVPGLPQPVPHGTLMMMRSLERVGRISGRSASLRHGTIEERIRFLAAHATNPAVREDFLRKRRALLVGIATGALVAVGAAAAQVPSDLRVARSAVAHQEAADFYEAASERAERGAADEAAPLWDRAFAGFEEAQRLVGDAGDPRARRLRVLGAYYAAQAALQDPARRGRAKPKLEETLRLLADTDLPEAFRAQFTFHARVDLGWVLAAEGDVAGAKAQRERAERIGDAADRSGDAAFRADRLAFLDALVLGAEGAKPEAAKALGDLERRAATKEGSDWDELRRAAASERARLEGR